MHWPPLLRLPRRVLQSLRDAVTTVHLVHGIHTEPDSRVKGLIPYLKAAGFDVKYPEYGYELAVETRYLNPIIEGVMQPYVESGDIFVGHSNGCAITYHLMQMGAPVIGAVFINGALERTLRRPGNCSFIDVYYNPGDEITEVAKIGAEFGIFDEDWGELGHSGYDGTDGLIENFNCGATAGMPIVSGHSDFFTPEKLAEWGPFLTKRLVALTASP